MSARQVAARLASPEVLERTSLAIAALDAVLSPDWTMRYFSFDPRWSAEERMASMRNGSGDSYRIVFGPAGTVVRGFDHESELSPWGLPGGELAPGVLEGFPDVLRATIDEPAFRSEGGPAIDLTFCAWRLANEDAWSAGPTDDAGGSAAWLLEVLLEGTPAGYARFASDYYEADLDLEVVASFFGLHPADAALVRGLVPDADSATVLADLRGFGYPVVDGAEQGS